MCCGVDDKNFKKIKSISNSLTLVQYNVAYIDLVWYTNVLNVELFEHSFKLIVTLHLSDVHVH